jgi:hypothetical protein
MRARPMLPQVHALPGTEPQSSPYYWNAFRRSRENASGMRGHVVRALRVVFPHATFWSEFAHPVLEVSQHRWICILLNGQAG